MNKRYAFTLAEVLMAIAILGIVVLLVVVGVRNQQNKAELYTAQYDKLYNDLYTVAKSVLVLDRKNSIKFGLGESSAELRNAFSAKMDVAKTWEAGEAIGAGDNDIVNWFQNDRELAISRNKIAGLTLNNGAAIGFLTVGNVPGGKVALDNALQLGNGTNTTLVGVLILDFNGPANPNRRGDDQNLIPLYSDGIRADSAGGRLSPNNVAMTNVATCAEFSVPGEITCDGAIVDGCSCECDDPDLIIVNGQCVRNCPSIAAADLVNANKQLDYDSATCWSWKPEFVQSCTNQGKTFNDDGTCSESGGGSNSCSQPCPNVLQKRNASCECECSVGNYGDFVEICGGEDKVDIANCTCFCEAGQIFDGNSCVSCSEKNMIPNENNTACVCKAQNVACPFGSTYNETTCSCDCPAYTTSEGTNEKAKCVCKTPADGCKGGSFNQDTCSCDCPGNLVTNGERGETATCACPLNESLCSNGIWVESSCVCTPCGQDAHPNSNHSACIANGSSENDPEYGGAYGCKGIYKRAELQCKPCDSDNEATPVWDDTEGGCTTCDIKSSGSKPHWDGADCVE